MRSHRTVLISIMLVFAVIALWAQTRQPSAEPGGSSPSAAAPVNPAPQSPFLRILTPMAGQDLGQNNFANVRYEVTSPAASAGTPNFIVQLDGNDPIHTTATEYNFTGLTPGLHTVTVTIVDANDTPVTGGRAQVQFKVAPLQNPVPSNTPRPGSPKPTSGTLHAPAVNSAPSVSEAAMFGPPTDLSADDDNHLPSANSALPLLSVIGFGVLLGGIASAMKTR